MNKSTGRHPFSGTFELTGRCNLKCQMCLVRVDQQRIQELGLRERSAAEWIDMAKQIFEAGTLELLLTGGEVMLRSDFCEIYQAIAQMGFVLTVYTNATLVTDEILALFRKYPPHKIGITMYGASNETYAALCGMKDGYDRFIAGFHKLRTLPSLIDLRTTLVQSNCEDLEAMQCFAERYFGSKDRLHISRFVCKPVRGGICKPEEIRLSPEDNVRITQSWMVQLSEEVRNDPAKKIIFCNNPRLFLEQKQSDSYNAIKETRQGTTLFDGCKAGIDQYAISWAGRMYACELMDRYYSAPFEHGFAYAWEHLLEQYPKPKEIPACVGCSYQSFCETCPANRLAETKDIFGTPEYACREAAYKYHLFE